LAFLTFFGFSSIFIKARKRGKTGPFENLKMKELLI